MHKEEKGNISEIECENGSYSDDALFNIASFGTDITFRELITMYDEGDLEKPEMQRKYVWDKNEASRFIDSILLGLPVPSIFLAKTEDEKRLIVDGYQRIMTVYDFVKRGVFGGDGKAFALSNSESINAKWRGKMFQELLPEEQRKIRNSPIHAIVFEQKEPKNDTGMYQIFERINTSGRTLKPQEIRNCVYHGAFNRLLIKLNEVEAWRKQYGKKDVDSRMLDVECILRMFSFSDIKNQEEITKNQIILSKYLSEYMGLKSDISQDEENVLEEKFKRNIEYLYLNIGDVSFKNGKKDKNGNLSFAKKINPAIMDSVYAAVDYAFEITDITHISNLYEKYCALIQDSDYQDAITNRTTNTEKIKKRISLATQILFGVDYEW